jgi:flavin-dependent dehydrogenase
MDVGHGGYVGRVRLADGRVHLAAALDPAACRGAAGGPEEVIRSILPESEKREGLHLRGTGLLTRRRARLGGHRVLAVGDACGYVEPFTGEGMGWAILAAAEVADMVPERGDWPADLPQRWERRHRALIERRQRWCRLLRPMMHHRAWAGMGLALGRAVPPAGALLGRAICWVGTAHATGEAG